MEKNLSPKLEAFCQAYVENGGNGSQAYRDSHSVREKTKPESIWERASKILSDYKVKSRIKSLQDAHRERHMITVDKLIAELEEARQAALTAETPQTSAAVSATMGKAKLAGLDKQIIEQTTKVIYDEDQARRMMEQYLSK